MRVLLLAMLMALVLGAGCSATHGSTDDTGTTANDTGTPDAFGCDGDLPPCNLVDTGTTPVDTGTTPIDTGSTGAIVCNGHDASAFPTFDRACTSDGDCTIGAHQTDCCGTIDAMGITHAEATRFASAEATCEAMYPACGCDSGTVHTDDGTMPPVGTDLAGVVVHCVASVCTTSARPSTPCGSATCTPTQVCVMECSGVPLPDGGMLASHCVDVPSACATRSDCACFPSNPCPTGSCEGVQNGAPLCLCA